MGLNSSVIVVLLGQINLEQLITEIQKYQGKVLHTTLPFENEQKLLQAIS